MKCNCPTCQPDRCSKEELEGLVEITKSEIAILNNALGSKQKNLEKISQILEERKTKR